MITFHVHARACRRLAHVNCCQPLTPSLGEPFLFRHTHVHVFITTTKTRNKTAKRDENKLFTNSVSLFASDQQNRNLIQIVLGKKQNCYDKLQFNKG